MERKNLWAPWRINYIQQLDKTSNCFICDDLDNPDKDKENLVLWRCPNCVVILNRYPYNNGHLLIAPIRHIPDLTAAADDEMLEMMKLINQSQKALSLAINPHGFNVGANFGRCAGAGLPEHFHLHVVPRWSGDTNFMSVCSDANIISQSLVELHETLKEISLQHNLPCL